MFDLDFENLMIYYFCWIRILMVVVFCFTSEAEYEVLQGVGTLAEKTNQQNQRTRCKNFFCAIL